MISAAVKGLARLSYEFGDLISSAYNILPSTFLLLQRKNREIIKVDPEHILELDCLELCHCNKLCFYNIILKFVFSCRLV